MTKLHLNSFFNNISLCSHGHVLLQASIKVNLIAQIDFIVLIPVTSATIRTWNMVHITSSGPPMSPNHSHSLKFHTASPSLRVLLPSYINPYCAPQVLTFSLTLGDSRG